VGNITFRNVSTGTLSCASCGTTGTGFIGTCTNGPNGISSISITNRGKGYTRSASALLRCVFSGVTPSVTIGGTNNLGGQRLVATIAGDAEVKPLVGKASGKSGSHEACLDWSWADNAAYVIAGPLEKLRRRLQGASYSDKVDFIVRRNTNTSGGVGARNAGAGMDSFNLTTLNVNSTLLDSERLYWFFKQAIGKNSLLLRNVACVSGGPSGRAGQDNADYVHSVISCIGDTDVWGLMNVRLEMVFMEVSNVSPDGEPVDNTKMQMHMALFTVVAPKVSLCMCMLMPVHMYARVCACFLQTPSPCIYVCTYTHIFMCICMHDLTPVVASK
jgi:hypothetical protein